MQRLCVVVMLLMLGGCMSVSDMGVVARDQLSDAGVLDHSQTRRSTNFRLQPDSFIYIAQGAFVPPGGA